MRILEIKLEQGSPEWIQWRKEGVGASDVPAILGISPYISENKLWKIKKNIIKDYQISEYAKIMGGQAEEEARISFNELTGKVFEPKCFQMENTPYKCSLDGYCNGEIFEAKFVAQDYYLDLKSGKDVRPDHFAQLQWQMYVTGSTDANYFVTTKSGAKLALTVERNDNFIAKCKDAVDVFMSYMEANIEPPLGKDDYYEVAEDQFDLSTAFDKIEVVKKQIEALKIEEEKLRAYLISNAKHDKMSYKNMKLFKTIRAGGIDYKKFCEKNGFVVSSEFEKKPTESWTLKIGEKE
ncbi:MAG: lambda-exonuclease family protein [Nitrososphaerales archaeon]